jgi:hypothetical protein
MLDRVLEEDGDQVAFAPYTIAALASLYLNPYPLVVIVGGASIHADGATLDLVAADVGPLGRHRYIVLTEMASDEFLSSGSSLAILRCAFVRSPVTLAQVREVVIQYALRPLGYTPDLAELNAVAR